MSTARPRQFARQMRDMRRRNRRAAQDASLMWVDRESAAAVRHLSSLIR